MTIRKKRGRTKAKLTQSEGEAAPATEATEATDTNGQPEPEKAEKKKKPKKKKIDKEKLEREKITELLKVRGEFGLAVADWEEQHAKAAELKKTMERKQLVMHSIVADIAAIRSGNYTPPLPFGEDGQATAHPADLPADLAPDGPWRDVPLSDVVDGKALLESLKDAGVNTIGVYRDYRAANKKIPGIGPGKQSVIDDGLVDFWAKNPQFVGATAS